MHSYRSSQIERALGRLATALLKKEVSHYCWHLGEQWYCGRHHDTVRDLCRLLIRTKKKRRLNSGL